jgi:hypothetical protein
MGLLERPFFSQSFNLADLAVVEREFLTGFLTGFSTAGGRHAI